MQQQYINESQQRILRIIECLAGHEVGGLSPAEIRQRVDIAPGTLTRDLENLKHSGWIEPSPLAPERLRLGVKPIKLAEQHKNGMSFWRTQLERTIAQYGE